MKPKQIVTTLIIVTLNLGLISSTFAGDSKKKQTGKPITRPKVTAVSGDSITLGPKTYTVNQTTEIYVNGAHATMDAVQTGMEGEVTAGMDPTVAYRISVYASNDKASDTKQSDDKKKKK